MKRPFLIIAALFFFSNLFHSCKSQERCPAYGQESEEQEQEERV